jgi:hypothetical protein
LSNRRTTIINEFLKRDEIMKYRVLTLLGVLALSAGVFIQAQDYDDIYYDASKTSGSTKAAKVTTPAKTVAVYGEVPERYKAVAESNYRVERDEDEYNRRGAYEPEFEVDINGDTIYEEAFANTRRIERFYNPDIVILSDDDDLVELYYDESPTVNLIIGSDWDYTVSYGWDWPGYLWRHSWYDPWYDFTWRSTWWSYGWYSPYYYNSWYAPRLWGWTYWGPRTTWGIGWGGYYGWYDPGYWHGPAHHYGDYARHGYGTSRYVGGNHGGSRTGLATNRNGRHSTSAAAPGRSGISSRGTGRGGTATTRGGGNIGTRGTSGRGGGTATTRGGGNMGSRGTSGVTPRSSGSVSRPSSGTRSSGTSYGGSRSSSSSHSSGGSYSGGSRSSGGGSYSGGSHSSGGHSGGSAGGGGRRR